MFTILLEPALEIEKLIYIENTEVNSGRTKVMVWGAFECTSRKTFVTLTAL